jgi:hypothetical protein
MRIERALGGSRRRDARLRSAIFGMKRRLGGTLRCWRWGRQWQARRDRTRRGRRDWRRRCGLLVVPADAKGGKLFQQRAPPRLNLNGGRGLFAAMDADLLLDDRRQILDLGHPGRTQHRLFGRRRKIFVRYRLLDPWRRLRGVSDCLGGRGMDFNIMRSR